MVKYLGVENIDIILQLNSTNVFNVQYIYFSFHINLSTIIGLNKLYS